MPDMWLIFWVIAGFFGVIALVRVLSRSRTRSEEAREPTSPPADAGAEGMLASGPGDISPGEPDLPQRHNEQ